MLSHRCIRLDTRATARRLGYVNCRSDGCRYLTTIAFCLSAAVYSKHASRVDGHNRREAATQSFRSDSHTMRADSGVADRHLLCRSSSLRDEQAFRVVLRSEPQPLLREHAMRRNGVGHV